MNFIFGTVEEGRALEYITRALFDKEIDATTAEPILRLIREGKIRLGDPMMYNGTAPIFPEKDCSKEDEKIIHDWYSALRTKINYIKTT